jgi:hypothetical protein
VVLSFHDATKQQGIEVANEQQYLMVLGGPGSANPPFCERWD